MTVLHNRRLWLALLVTAWIVCSIPASAGEEGRLPGDASEEGRGVLSFLPVVVEGPSPDLAGFQVGLSQPGSDEPSQGDDPDEGDEAGQGDRGSGGQEVGDGSDSPPAGPDRDPDRRGSAEPAPRGIPGGSGLPDEVDDGAPELKPGLCGALWVPFAQDCAEDGQEPTEVASGSGLASGERGPRPAGEGDPHGKDGPGNRALVWGAGITLSALFLALLYRVWAVVYLGSSFFPMGWRLDRDRVIDHPVRKAILGRLEDHPGATVQELADHAGVRNNRAVYHLSILLREELVSKRVVEGRKHFFLRSAPRIDPDRLKKRVLTRSDRAPGRILGYLVRSPGATVSQIARSLGFSPGHAHYHLTRLAGEGLLDRTRRGRRVRHYLTREAHDLIGDPVPAPERGPGALGDSAPGVSV